MSTKLCLRPSHYFRPPPIFSFTAPALLSLAYPSLSSLASLSPPSVPPILAPEPLAPSPLGFSPPLSPSSRCTSDGAYVGNRCLSSTNEYEETGWHDGQIWVKTPKVLACDRLLGSFSVKPVLSRVKLTLVGLAVSLVICILLLINIENPKDSSEDIGGRAIAGVYNDASARSLS